MTVHVTTPCRLHFGLLHVPVPGLTHWPDGTPIRPFGGIGAMVQSPRVEVIARSSRQLEVSSCPLMARALRIGVAQNWPIQISMSVNGPEEHTGLGVGTALTLAITKAYGVINQQEAMITIAGRGQRSQIGVAGFKSGGFIFDPGHGEPPLHHTTPEPWRIVLFQPRVAAAWHGEREREAFHTVQSHDEALKRYTRLRAWRSMLEYSLNIGDFEKFTKSLGEFNRVAGEPFAAAQGGVYSSPEVTSIIERLNALGFLGVGQSSWGPTVFAFCQSQNEAEEMVDHFANFLPEVKVLGITAIDTQGARVTVT